MKTFSFILPTNRHYESFSGRVVENIKSLNFGNDTFEIILVSPNNIVQKADNIIPIKDPGGGCVNAYNAGYGISTGKYIILCSDDHVFDFNVPKIIDVLEGPLFQDRRYKIICLPTNKHGSCKLPEYANCNAIIARYPVFRRDTVDQYLNGFIYHPNFKHHYPDNWLGFWLARQGEPAIEHNKYDMLTFFNACDKQYDLEDELAFKTLIQNYNNGNTSYV